VVVWGRVHLGLRCLALVSPADDAEDHQSGGDGDSQESNVRRWSGIRSNKLDCDYLALTTLPFVRAVRGAGEGEPTGSVHVPASPALPASPYKITGNTWSRHEMRGACSRMRTRTTASKWVNRRRKASPYPIVRAGLSARPGAPLIWSSRRSCALARSCRRPRAASARQQPPWEIHLVDLPELRRVPDARLTEQLCEAARCPRWASL
jgi:hypothetical protein